MKLSIIIVNYNVKFYLMQCLQSIRQSKNSHEYEIIVVDNHSHDDSVKYIKRHFPEVMLIENMHNVGFARANNQGIACAHGDYVLLLNPDTILGEDVLSGCIDFMESHPDAGGVGVKMLTAGGKKAMESRRGIPTPLTSFFKMSGLCSRFPHSKVFAKYYMSYLPWDTPQQIEIISGAFCMMRREVLDKTGWLDEDFFMYGEDIDLSYRLLKSGTKNWYLPLSILHYKGESTKKSSFRYVHVFYQAMLIFMRKHYGHSNILLTVPIKAAIYFKASLELMAILTKKASKSLGFFKTNRRKSVRYLFLGEHDMLDSCRLLAKHKGLQGDFMEVSPTQGLAEVTIPTVPAHSSDGSQWCVVFDCKTIAYSSILKFIEEHEDKNIILGIYHSHENMIITPDEIIKREGGH